MVGFRWIVGWALLALACGRTADSDDKRAEAPRGGTGSGGGAMVSGGAAASGSAPVTGQAGEATLSECPVTPAAGEWLGISPDPYGFDITSDGSHLSGRGCLGGLPSQGSDPLACGPLRFSADNGRRVSFIWNMNEGTQLATFGYAVRMDLTLSPERTELAGKIWTSLGSLDGEGKDIVLLRYPGQPVPPATICSDGEPSGACFLAPLRSDRLHDLRVLQLGGGDLLLLWQNQRGIGRHLAGAHFDAAAGAWGEAEFLDDGSSPVVFPLVAASAEGRAMLVYQQNDLLLTRAYDPKRNAWGEQKELMVLGGASADWRPEKLFVYDGGDATLITSGVNGSHGLSAHDYVAKTGLWKTPQLVTGSPDVAPAAWTAAANSARSALVFWAIGGLIGEPYHLWFSSRTAAGAWTEPARFYTGPKQIVYPAAAVGPDDTAIVTWEEFRERVASSSYSFASGVWSEPLTVTTELEIENRSVRLTEAGIPVAYFHRSSGSRDDAEQKTELVDGVWSAPQKTTVDEAYGTTYTVAAQPDGLQLTPFSPSVDAPTPPPLSRARCEGYDAATQLSNEDDGTDKTAAVNERLELTLRTVGPGSYADPVISSPALSFDGTTFPAEQNPGGPTQIYRFHCVAQGTALVTIPHDGGGRDAFTITLHCGQ